MDSTEISLDSDRASSGDAEVKLGMLRRSASALMNKYAHLLMEKQFSEKPHPNSPNSSKTNTSNTSPVNVIIDTEEQENLDNPKQAQKTSRKV